MSIISRHLKYMNTLIFQNILALLETRDFCPGVNLCQRTVKNSFKIPQKYTPPRYVMLMTPHIMHHNK